MLNIKSKVIKLIKKIIWQIDIPVQFFEPEAIHLDLGAGNVPRNPFNAKNVYATDFHASFVSKDGFNLVQADLTQKLPFDDKSWTVKFSDFRGSCWSSVPTTFANADQD